MKYRKEIDGLRSLAVLPVILFHAGFTTFSGGFVGVDIFFVISGYLITTIIVDEMDKDSFSLLIGNISDSIASLSILVFAVIVAKKINKIIAAIELNLFTHLKIAFSFRSGNITLTEFGLLIDEPIAEVKSEGWNWNWSLSI